MEVSKDLRIDIEKNQTLLKIAIKNHQVLILKLRNDPECTEIRFKVKEAQNNIITIGLEQKVLVQKLRKELRIHQKNSKINLTKTGVEDRKTNLTNIIKQTKKQAYNSRSASVSSASISDDSQDDPLSPTVHNLPLLPYELSQSDFLNRLGLCTHEVFKELQNKRVERKRRSTANPHFLYGNRWDHNTKRKKNSYLISSLSPPHTRQSSLKNKQRAEQRGISPPNRTDSRSSSPVHKKNLGIGLNIPNLPSGLTIERVDSNRSSPDNKQCTVCHLPGALTVCESCNSNFHIGCHNRPLVQQPKQCPRCHGKQNAREVGSMNLPSMTVLTTYVSAEVKDKTQEKKALLEKNKALNGELAQLEERKTDLNASLRKQEVDKEELLSTQKATKQNIQRLIDFVNTMKGNSVKAVSPPPAPSPVAVSDGS